MVVNVYLSLKLVFPLVVLKRYERVIYCPGSMRGFLDSTVRLATIVVSQFRQTIVVLLEILYFLVLNTVDAVSYTHLDVYKRQVLGHRK